MKIVTTRLTRITMTLFMIIGLIISSLGTETNTSAAFKEDVVKAKNGKTHVINGFNQLRGGNQLVAYTPEFGESTKNNRWGVEVVVENNIITEVRDGTIAGNDAFYDAPIPDNGFVLSGHGTARTWIINNLHEGETVEILYDIISDPTKTSTFSIKSIDPQAPHAFPGGRGGNELIAYTPAYESATTGTNQYGAEVIVRNGIVVEMSGSNSPIPQDGFVLSGHGLAKDWLLQFTQVGAKITMNKETMKVTATIDASSYIRASELVLKEAEASIENAEQKFLDVPLEQAKLTIQEAKDVIVEAEAAFEVADWTKTIEHSEKATQLAKNASFLTVESRVVDARGVWHRPVEKNREEIIATLDRLSESNYNMLFLETFFHGYTIYPGKIAEQNPDFLGWDPLAVFIEEGKKRGIEVHAWVHTFFVGHESLHPPGPILKEHPNWAAVDRQGDLPSKKEVGYYYVNPALPEVRDFLSTLFNETTSNYDLSGLHLDYIRYPVSMPYDVGYSYDEYSRSEFKKETGYDPLEITPDGNPEAWEKWNVWREQQITTFVERIYKETKSLNPEIDLSTAVFPEVSDAIDQKFQNWIDWVEAGYMDFITPMVYSVDKNYVAKATEDFLNNMKSPVLSYIGLAPFIGFSDDLLVNQVNSVYQKGASGQVQFAYHNLKDFHFNSLKIGPQRKEAVVPHRDPMNAASMLVSDIKRKVRDVYVAKGAMKKTVQTPLTAKLNQIIHKLEKKDIKGALQHKNVAEEFINERQKQINEHVIEHLHRDFDQLEKILEFAEFDQGR
ncbi:glycoside hydrolase family 10 protein [Bacillus sp. DJP31]|uniref:glycoside hydrolase family 10 protein n=1 Tax=Bacillus sp. DJP31 TaxID=3409789 RepID=UPI003BB74440